MMCSVLKVKFDEANKEYEGSLMMLTFRTPPRLFLMRPEKLNSLFNNVYSITDLPEDTPLVIYTGFKHKLGLLHEQNTHE